MVALSQAYLEWEQTRIEQGIQQGIQQGIERERSLILRLLTRRLGSLPGWMVLPINLLTLTQLESLGEALLDFTTTTDLIRWLLVCRFGDQSEQALSQVLLRVNELTPTQLEDLGEVFVRFSVLAELENWLDVVA